MGDHGLADGYEGPPFADMKCVMDALREQGIVLTEILERLPDTRGHHHSKAARSAAVQVEPGPNDTSRDPVLEGAAQDDAGKVEPEAKDTCDAGLEGAALDDAVQVEFPPDPNDPPKAKNLIDHFPIVRMIGNDLTRRRSSWDERPKNGISTRVHEMVTHTGFEVFFGVMILINTVVMVLEEQWQGAEVGYELGFYTFYGSDQMREDAFFISADSLFRVAEALFAIIFTIEVSLRITGSGCQFFKRHSECFDLAVVVLSDFSVLINSIDTGINVQLLRLLRASKLFRLVKLMRAIEGFDALHIMVTALGASASALGWSIMLLVFIQTFSSMIVTYFFRSAYFEQSSSLSEDAKLELFEYFGTFARTVLSLFELSLANWPPICRWLMENLNEGFMVFVLLFKFVMGIAVIGVINAVFMQETFKVAHSDNDIMVRMKNKATNEHRGKMESLFRVADVDGDGRIERHEFLSVIMDQTVAVWLASMDMNHDDADMMFDLMKGDDECLSVDELISGVARLRSGARSIDLHRLLQKMDGHHSSAR